MNKLIVILIFISTQLLAGDYVVVFLDNRIIPTSLDTALLNIQAIGADVRTVTATNMPVYYNTADTNITGKVVCIRVDSLGKHEWKQMPLSQVETRVTKDVRPPDRQLIMVKDLATFKAEYFIPVSTNDIVVGVK